jgi:hypothetical protein
MAPLLPGKEDAVPIIDVTRTTVMEKHTRKSEVQPIEHLDAFLIFGSSYVTV